MQILHRTDPQESAAEAPPGPTESGSFFLARQPIFDRNLKVFGYELLFRSGMTNRAEIRDPDEATTQVIVHAFSELPIEQLIGGRKPFINLTRNFLLGKIPIPFTPRQVVLEIPETIQKDPTIIEPLRELSRRGYRLALDDVADPREVAPLLELADFVKLDLIDIGIARLPAAVNYLHTYHGRLLAEKVETLREFELCKRLGVEYFQGNFLSKPRIVQGRRVPATRLVVLQLIGELQNPAIKFSDLEKVIAQDPTLSYKILKLINSSFYGLTIEVKSLAQAIAILGLDQLSRWAVLFLVHSLDFRPRELSIQALVRARMCELMAAAAGEKCRDSFFMAGLFSLLEAMLGIPMSQIVDSIPLAADIRSALLERSGRIGEALNCVEAYERADWQHVVFSGLNMGAIGKSYLDSLQWASQVTAAAGV